MIGPDYPGCLLAQGTSGRGGSHIPASDSMRYEILNQKIHIPDSLQKAIDHKVTKINNRLKRYHPEAAHLEIRLDKTVKPDEFACDLKLKAFKESLFASKSAPELRVAVDKSFEAILKELDHYRLKLQNP